MKRVYDKNNIFYKIIHKEIPSTIVYEDDKILAFNDINPKAPVHMLVVPKLHVDSLNELDDEVLLGKLMMTVKEAAKKVGLKSYRTQINTGKEAGQEVFHLHIHILGKV